MISMLPNPVLTSLPLIINLLIMVDCAFILEKNMLLLASLTLYLSGGIEG